MPDLTITIPLDAQTARAYNTASPEEKKKRNKQCRKETGWVKL